MNPIFLIVAGTVAALVLVWAVLAFLTYWKYRGKRLITCPENHQTAAVEVATSRAAARTFILPGTLTLKDCSRWPEMQGCGQECLSQVEENPHDCLVWNIVGNWYEGKECAVCGKTFTKLEWHAHRPALMDARGRTVKWSDVPAENLPALLAKFRPVCWDCHVAEEFRRQHAELITDRERKAS